MIEILSTDVSDDAPTCNEDNSDDKTIEEKIISILSYIIQQCSEQIYRVRNQINDKIDSMNIFRSFERRSLIFLLVQFYHQK
jgi:hypothetical protein